MTTASSLPETLEIREFCQDDLATVCAIERVCQEHPWTQSHFESEWNNPVARIDVCLIDGDIAGFICTWLIAGELQVQNLATAPAYRRRGVAGYLLKHALERGRASGPLTAWLEVRVDNRPAIALYRSYGFVEQSRRPKYYHDGGDALVMCLAATP